MRKNDQPADRAGYDGLNNDFDSKWSNDDPVIETFQFIENEGLNINVPDADDPIFFFNLFPPINFCKLLYECQMHMFKVLSTLLIHFGEIAS